MQFSLNNFLLFRNDYWHYGASVETLREFVDMFNAFIMENTESRIVGFTNQWAKNGKIEQKIKCVQVVAILLQ